MGDGSRGVKTAVHRRASGDGRGARRPREPLALVLFGASGDLAQRKIFPALYRLAADGLLPEEFSLVGVDRTDPGDEGFREAIEASIRRSDEVGEVDDDALGRLVSRARFVGGDFAREGTYRDLRRRLGEAAPASGDEGGRLFYLAIPPAVFDLVVEGLSASGLAPRTPDAAFRPWARLVVEKPFGRSLATARELNRKVGSLFGEHQIYRIDHYLGKETVQNILVLRFGNSIFEPVWNREHVESVEILAAETLGVEHRAGYYERAGALRDMFQSHLFQLVALTAMEPPAGFRAEAVRNEKVKVLESIRPPRPAEIDRHLAVGQYGAGRIGDRPVPAYRREDGVHRDSKTATYAALRLEIDSWRWRGVPFLVRSGKRLARRVTEIAVRFHTPPLLLFRDEKAADLASNLLVLRLQPDEGVSLRFEVKHPGVVIAPASVQMDFRYRDAFGEGSYPAYETLLLDAIEGDPTLFARGDEVEAAWRVIDPYLEAAAAAEPAAYPAGSWGPGTAARILPPGHRFREP